MARKIVTPISHHNQNLAQWLRTLCCFLEVFDTFSTFSTSSARASFPSLVPETLFSASVVFLGWEPDAAWSVFSILLTPLEETISRSLFLV